MQLKAKTKICYQSNLHFPNGNAKNTPQCEMLMRSNYHHSIPFSAIMLISNHSFVHFSYLMLCSFWMNSLEYNCKFSFGNCSTPSYFVPKNRIIFNHLLIWYYKRPGRSKTKAEVNATQHVSAKARHRAQWHSFWTIFFQCIHHFKCKINVPQIQHCRGIFQLFYYRYISMCSKKEKLLFFFKRVAHMYAIRAW